MNRSPNGYQLISKILTYVNRVLTADEVVKGLRGPLRQKHIGSSSIWCLAMVLWWILSLVFRVSIVKTSKIKSIPGMPWNQVPWVQFSQSIVKASQSIPRASSKHPRVLLEHLQSILECSRVSLSDLKVLIEHLFLLILCHSNNKNNYKIIDYTLIHF